MSKPEFVEWVDATPRQRRMRHEGFEYLEHGLGWSYGRKTVYIERVAGDWPSDKDLITIADGGCPEHPYHFGGEVHGSGDRRAVAVYID